GRREMGAFGIALRAYRRSSGCLFSLVFFFQAEDGIRDRNVTGVQTCALPISSPFSVTWQPAEGTADIASYRIEVNDNGAGWALWIASTTATSGSYSGQDGHTYQFRSIATDNAGNVESKSTNDSWTIVDMSPPDSVVIGLPPFENTVQFTVSWGPVGGTTDIATYQVQVREGAGAWVDLACCSSTTSAST